MKFAHYKEFGSSSYFPQKPTVEPSASGVHSLRNPKILCNIIPSISALVFHVVPYVQVFIRNLCTALRYMLTI